VRSENKKGAKTKMINNSGNTTNGIIYNFSGFVCDGSESSEIIVGSLKIQVASSKVSLRFVKEFMLHLRRFTVKL